MKLKILMILNFQYFVKFKIIPAIPRIAKICSTFPKSKLVKIIHIKNGIPIICPIRIIKEYEIRETIFSFFSTLNFIFFK